MPHTASSLLPCDLASLVGTPLAGVPTPYMPAGESHAGFFCVHLPAGLQQVAILSDIHLNAKQPENFEAWARFMRGTQAQAVLLLGDIFDVWVGDDVLDEKALASNAPRSAFAKQCVDVLRECTESGVAVYVMHGNRDFLLGSRFFEQTGCLFLPDPCVLQWHVDSDGGKRIDIAVLTHGDALCTGDTEYMAFREMVRSAAWQQSFLNKSLLERIKIAEAIRQNSEKQQSMKDSYTDVEDDAVKRLLQTTNQMRLIHGHTHRAACYTLQVDGLNEPALRYVLSDWDVMAQPARADALLIDATGSLQRIVL